MAETHTEAINPLRAQGNLRQQHQDLTAPMKRGGDGLKIDLGLAGTRHAVQQCYRKTAFFDILDKLVRRFSLRFVQFRPRMLRHGPAAPD